jgi:hypothetical protein
MRASLLVARILRYSRFVRFGHSHNAAVPIFISA